MTEKRARQDSPLRLLLGWLTRRGPGVILLRVFAQTARIVTGRPVFRYARITPSLYVGGQHRIYGWPAMQEEGITAVVNMRREVDDLNNGVASERYLYLPTTDNRPPTLEDLRRGVDFITEEIERGGKVYIHCGVGVGRAPTMAAAYLISTGMTPEQAWRTIRRVRPFIWPMRGQTKRIKQFYEQFSPGE